MSSVISFSAPPCKPLRIMEWLTEIVCFILLFFTRNYAPDQLIILTPNELIFLFITSGSLMVLTGGDVLAQLLREPTSNIPMILVNLLGSTFSFVTGVFLTNSYLIHSECDDKRSLSVIFLIIFASFFACAVYLIDAIILIRYASIARPGARIR